MNKKDFRRKTEVFHKERKNEVERKRMNLGVKVCSGRLAGSNKKDFRRKTEDFGGEKNEVERRGMNLGVKVCFRTGWIEQERFFFGKLRSHSKKNEVERKKMDLGVKVCSGRLAGSNKKDFFLEHRRSFIFARRGRKRRKKKKFWMEERK